MATECVDVHSQNAKSYYETIPKSPEDNGTLVERETITLNLPSKSTMACFKAHNKTQTVSIVVKKARYVCVNTFLYWIPATPTFKVSQSFHCMWNAFEGDYGNWKDCRDNKHSKEIFRNGWDRLGKSGCDLDFSYSCNSCWSLHAPTSYWKLDIINPSKKAYRVFKCDSWHLVLQLEVFLKYKNQPIMVDQNVSLTTMGTSKVKLFNDTMELNLVSYNTDLIPLAGLCFVYDEETKKMASIHTCATEEVDQFEGVGGLSCSSKAAASQEFLKYANCSMIKSITRVPEHSSCSETFTKTNLMVENNIFKYQNVLTHKFSTFDISQTPTGENVQVEVFDRVSGQLIITTNHTKLTQQHTCGTCSIKPDNQSLVGEWGSVRNGADLLFYAKSDLQNDVGTVVCNPGHLERTVKLTGSFEKITTQLHPNFPAMYTCYLSCCLNTLKFVVNGTTLRTPESLTMPKHHENNHDENTITAYHRNEDSAQIGLGSKILGFFGKLFSFKNPFSISFTTMLLILMVFGFAMLYLKRRHSGGASNVFVMSEIERSTRERLNQYNSV